MGDKDWDELLHSPYEEKQKKQRKAPSGTAGLIVGLIGAVVVGGFVGWMLAPEPSQPGAAATTTTTMSTTTTAAIPTEPGFLPGFVTLGDTAFAPIAQFESGDKTYVAVSEIVGSDGDRVDTTPTVIGRYMFPTDSAVREVTAVAAPGVRLIEFDTLVEAATLEIEMGTEPVSQSSCVECIPFSAEDADTVVEFTGFPMEITDPGLDVELAEGQVVSFDRILIEDEWGVVDWHIESDNESVAQVSFYVYFLDTELEQSDGGISGPASLLPRSELGPRFGQSQPPATPGMAPRGQIQLSRSGPPLTSENPPTGVAIRWSVTWTTPTDTSATLEPAPVWGAAR